MVNYNYKIYYNASSPHEKGDSFVSQLLFKYILVHVTLIIFLIVGIEASNAEITGPKITTVFDSRGGLNEEKEHGVRK